MKNKIRYNNTIKSIHLSTDEIDVDVYRYVKKLLPYLYIYCDKLNNTVYINIHTIKDDNVTEYFKNLYNTYIILKKEFNIDISADIDFVEINCKYINHW